MFIFTAKLSRKKIAAGLGAAGVLLIGLILMLSGNKAAGSEPSPKGVKTQADRIAYLASYGWEADAGSEECQEVVIPTEFDSVFEGYNNLQKEQGFDLAKYKGKRITRYMYVITNHEQTPVYASVLIHKNTVIGGDLQNPAPGGFLRGFKGRE